jgi:plasmid stabilization system protein ParE
MVDRFRAITHVLKQEGASSLGSAGRKLRTAVDMLQRFDRSGADPHSARRSELLANAAYLLSAYVIQREAIGLRNHRDLTAEFDLTAEIWNRVGAVR